MLGKKNRGWIGVDLGERSIKIAQLRRSGDRLSLQSAAIYPRTGRSLSEDLIGATMLADQTVGSRVASTLSMANSLVEPAEVASPEPDQCWDTWSAGQDNSYVLSVPNERVEAALDGFSAAGLSCETVDGTPQALARAVQLTPGWRPDELLGVLDWGESTVTFLGAQGGVASYVRRLRSKGFSAIRDEVANSLGVGNHDADKAIQRWGISTDAGAQGRRVAEVLRSAVHTTSQEISRTLEHLRGKLKTPGPKRLVVLGVGATVAGLPESLGRGVGLPTKTWSASGLEPRDTRQAPDCLMAQAISLSALAWEAGA